MVEYVLLGLRNSIKVQGGIVSFGKICVEIHYKIRYNLDK